jgi:hypothetical protein
LKCEYLNQLLLNSSSSLECDKKYHEILCNAWNSNSQSCSHLSTKDIKDACHFLENIYNHFVTGIPSDLKSDEIMNVLLELKNRIIKNLILGALFSCGHNINDFSLEIESINMNQREIMLELLVSNIHRSHL